MNSFFNSDFFNMLNINSLILDFLIIIIILYNAIKSAKQGFISSFISLILTITAYIFSIPISELISKNIYDLYLRDAISKIIENKLVDNGLSDFASLKNILNDKWSEAMNYFNYNIQQVNDINDNVNNISSINEISNIMSDKLIYPILNILICIIVLIIISFVFSILIKLLNKIFRFFLYIPILGWINSLLGCIFGVGKAFVIITFINLIINSLIFVSNDNLSFLNSEVKGETYVFKYIDNLIDKEKIFDCWDEIKGKFSVN